MEGLEKDFVIWWSTFEKNDCPVMVRVTSEMETILSSLLGNTRFC